MQGLPPGFVLDEPAPAAGGFVPLTGPDPRRVAEAQRAPVELEAARLGVEAKRADAAAAPFKAREAVANATKAEADAALAQQKAKAKATADPVGKARAELRRNLNLIDQIEKDAADNGGWFETGYLGSLMRDKAGTPAYDLSSTVKTLDASAAFAALAEMRANSPTGAALGSVSDREMELLKSTVANLDPNQGQEAFLKSLQRARQTYADMLERIEADAPQAAEAERDDGLAPLNNRGTEYIGGFNDELPPQPLARLDPKVEAELVAFARNPRVTAADLDRKAAELGTGLANSAAIIEARDKGAGVSPDFAYSMPAPIDTGTGAAGALGRGAASGVTAFFADELAGLGDTLGEVVHEPWGEGDTFKDKLYRNIDRNRAIYAYDELNHPTAQTIGELGGSVALPFGSALPGRLALVRGRSALRAGQGRAMANSAARVGAARGTALVGAGYGATAGAGAGEGGALDRVPSALGGSAAGAVGGYGAGRLAPMVGDGFSALSRRVRPSGTDEGRGVVEAATELGIEAMPADVSGPLTRRLTAGAAQLPFSAPAVIGRATRNVDEAGAARDQIAARAGTVRGMEGAGEAARRGAQNYIRRTSQEGEQLYRQARTQAGDARVPLPRAIAALDNNIAEMADTPGGVSEGAMREWNGIREALDGDWTPDGVRRLRTALRERFTEQGLTGGDVSRRINQVVTAAEQDMIEGLRAAGRGDAARTYQRAARYWRQRMTNIERTIAPIIGKDGEKSGEQVMKSIQQAAEGNNRRLQRFMRSLSNDEAADVRASVIGRMGQAPRGQQDATGEAFSLNTFLTQWNALTPEAKNTLFRGETRRQLDNLATYAGGTKAAQRYANTSNTGGAVGAGIAIGNVGGVFVEPVSAAMAVLGQYAAGRLLASPNFARWLAGAPPRRTATGDSTFLRGLTRIATREPALRNEVAQLHARLVDAFSPQKIAAEGEDEQRPAN